jgi:hypothetical protein
MKCEKKNTKQQVGVTKKSEGWVRRKAEAHNKSTTAHVSVLLVLEVLSDSEDILSRPTQVTRKDVLIRMRE